MLTQDTTLQVSHKGRFQGADKICFNFHFNKRLTLTRYVSV